MYQTQIKELLKETRLLSRYTILQKQKQTLHATVDKNGNGIISRAVVFRFYHDLTGSVHLLSVYQITDGTCLMEVIMQLLVTRYINGSITRDCIFEVLMYT